MSDCNDKNSTVTPFCGHMCPQNMGIITKKKKLLLLATSMSILARLKRKSKRSCWTRGWIMRRDERSMNSTLVRELAVEDGAEYHAMFRMDEAEADFNYLLNLVSSLIAKQDTLLRTSISARERLEVTLRLRYLATGRPERKERMSNYRVNWQLIFMIFCHFN